MISIDRTSRIPAYVQIYNHLKIDISQGAYCADDKLPSVRFLAEQLGVSRNTVGKAYQQLNAEGYVVSKDRSGYFVDPHILEYVDIPVASDCRFIVDTVDEEIVPPDVPAFFDPVSYDFFYGNILEELLPRDALRKVAVDALYESGRSGLYFDMFGNYEFRERLSRHLGKTRGVHCSAESIAIQSGTRDCMERFIHLFNPKEDVIAVEQPGWLGAAQVARNNHFSMRYLDVTDWQKFFEDIESSGAKIVYVTPSHQFPTGKIMPYAVRLRLIDWARRNDAYVLEDDYDSDYRYSELPVPSLQSLDSFGRVAYMGTFSKVFSSGMRTAYLVLPPQLVRPYRERLLSYWCPVSWLIQRMLSRLIESGDYERQVRKQMKYFRTSQSLLVNALRRELSQVVSISGEGAGLHVWLHAIDDRTADELTTLALEQGVRVYSGAPYWVDKDKVDNKTLLMGYSEIPHKDIEPGVARLKKAWLG